MLFRSKGCCNLLLRDCTRIQKKNLKIQNYNCRQIQELRKQMTHVIQTDRNRRSSKSLHEVREDRLFGLRSTSSSVASWEDFQAAKAGTGAAGGRRGAEERRRRALAATENVEERERDGKGGSWWRLACKGTGKKDGYIHEPETGPWKTAMVNPAVKRIIQRSYTWSHKGSQWVQVLSVG